MGFYPMFMEMERRKVVLIGGGHVALEKIVKLIDADADVTVISPELGEPMQALIDDGKAKLLQRAYEPGDIMGYEIVMIATAERNDCSF